MLIYTKHAAVRMQQRGIPRVVVALLLKYGKKTKARRGGKLCYFGNEGRKRVRRYLGHARAREFEHCLKTVAIIDGDQVVTCVNRWDRRIWQG